MASKPKKSEYEASEAEKINASVANADNKYFAENYDPIMVEMVSDAMSQNVDNLLAGRAGADTQQALSKPSLIAARSVDSAADTASAAGAQVLRARAGGEKAQKNLALSGLAGARGQQQDATTGLATLARLENSATLQSAERKLKNRQANIDFGKQLAGTAYQTGKTNIAAGGTFFGGGLDRSTGLKKDIDPSDENPGRGTIGDRLMGGLFG